jgi:hypothetical protein
LFEVLICETQRATGALAIVKYFDFALAQVRHEPRPASNYASAVR